MTSATGPKTRCIDAGAAAGLRVGLSRAHSRSAFTLMEIILALTIIVLVASMGIMSMGSFSDERQRMQAATWYEAVLRHARSEAMVAGRTMRLSFEAGTGRPVLLCESDPLGAPGQFDQPWQPWSDQPPADYRLIACRRDDSRAPDAAAVMRDDDDQELQALTFYPDGSSDWAELEIRSDRDSDAMVVVVQLNGFIGEVTSQTISPAERDEQATGP